MDYTGTLVLLGVALIACPLIQARPPAAHASTIPLYPPVDWVARGNQELQDALNVRPISAPARNVIIFIGDGMGLSTETAARMYKAQQAGQSVTDGHLSWDSMPYTGLVKVYNSDAQTPDSAGTATAFYCGEKTRTGVIGVNQNVPRGNCTAMQGNTLKSIIHHGMDAGKWTGIVSTSEFTAATTSSAYGHSPERNWKSNSDVPAGEPCWDLARQMIYGENNQFIKVLQAGGRAHFMLNTTADPEYTTLRGYRTDGMDLFQDWLDIHRNMTADDSQVVLARNLAEFNATDFNTVEYFMGCYEHRDMKSEADRMMEDPADTWSEPSLVQMVDKSLDVLQRSPQGYILLAEGDRIDGSHHDNLARRALVDTLGLDEAVQLAMDRTNPNDTLILVTADHSHTLTMSGYGDLEQDVLGFNMNSKEEVSMADDGLPYTVLGYTNGPGYNDHRTNGLRKNLTGVDTTEMQFITDAGIDLASETHSAEDVAVHARGPMAHLYGGVHEQHFISVAAMYAACIGPDTSNCGTAVLTNDATRIATGYMYIINAMLLLVVIVKMSN